MSNTLNWQRLQVSLNNFKINKLMSFTDIKNKLRLALNYADKSSQKYNNAKQISKIIKNLDNKDNFVQNSKDNQAAFKKLSKLMNPLVGYAKVNDPTTDKLNHLFEQAKAKEPTTIKKFNLRAHKKNHLSAQQAMLQAMGVEVKASKKNN